MDSTRFVNTFILRTQFSEKTFTILIQKGFCSEVLKNPDCTLTILKKYLPKLKIEEKTLLKIVTERGDLDADFLMSILPTSDTAVLKEIIGHKNTSVEVLTGIIEQQLFSSELAEEIYFNHDDLLRSQQGCIMKKLAIKALEKDPDEQWRNVAIHLLVDTFWSDHQEELINLANSQGQLSPDLGMCVLSVINQDIQMAKLPYQKMIDIVKEEDLIRLLNNALPENLLLCIAQKTKCRITIAKLLAKQRPSEGILKVLANNTALGKDNARQILEQAKTAETLKLIYTTIAKKKHFGSDTFVTIITHPMIDIELIKTLFATPMFSVSIAKLLIAKIWSITANQPLNKANRELMIHLIKECSFYWQSTQTLFWNDPLVQSLKLFVEKSETLDELISFFREQGIHPLTRLKDSSLVR